MCLKKGPCQKNCFETNRALLDDTDIKNIFDAEALYTLPDSATYFFRLLKKQTICNIFNNIKFERNGLRILEDDYRPEHEDILRMRKVCIFIILN